MVVTPPAQEERGTCGHIDRCHRHGLCPANEAPRAPAPGANWQSRRGEKHRAKWPGGGETTPVIAQTTRTAGSTTSGQQSAE